MIAARDKDNGYTYEYNTYATLYSDSSVNYTEIKETFRIKLPNGGYLAENGSAAISAYIDFVYVNGEYLMLPQDYTFFYYDKPDYSKFSPKYAYINYCNALRTDNAQRNINCFYLDVLTAPQKAKFLAQYDGWANEEWVFNNRYTVAAWEYGYAAYSSAGGTGASQTLRAYMAVTVYYEWFGSAPFYGNPMPEEFVKSGGVWKIIPEPWSAAFQ